MDRMSAEMDQMFDRVFGGVIADSAQASFHNGVLEVTMQAAPAEANRGRKIDIKKQ